MTAAATILERNGYDALNMRALAAELGVQAAALYRHVKSRDEVDDLLFDHLMADCVPRLGGKDWRADLMLLASAWRRRLVERRDATRIPLAKISNGPNIAPLMDATLDTLSQSGLCDAEVVEAYTACLVFVHGFATIEASHRAASVGSARGPRTATLRPEWLGAYPSLSRFADAIAGPADYDARFAFGLRALIAGIERRSERGDDLAR